MYIYDPFHISRPLDAGTPLPTCPGYHAGRERYAGKKLCGVSIKLGLHFTDLLRASDLQVKVHHDRVAELIGLALTSGDLVYQFKCRITKLLTKCRIMKLLTKSRDHSYFYTTTDQHIPSILSGTQQWKGTEYICFVVGFSMIMVLAHIKFGHWELVSQHKYTYSLSYIGILKLGSNLITARVSSKAEWSKLGGFWQSTCKAPNTGFEYIYRLWAA